MLANSRVDLVDLKQQLYAVVGSQTKFRLYWDTLRKFTVAKLSKRELDQQARELLGEDNIALHNRFILNIFGNAYCPHPPAGVVTTKRPPKASLSKSTKESKRDKKRRKEPSAAETKRHTKRIAVASASGVPVPVPVDKADATAADDASRHPTRTQHRKPNLLLPVPQPRLNTFVRVRKAPSMLSKLQADGELHLSLGSTPDLLPMRRKMMRTATESGIQDVSNDCVKYMMLALEWHLKDILSNALGKRKRRPNLGLPLGLENKLHPHELHSAVEIHPYVLGDRQLQREKIALLCDLPPSSPSLSVASVSAAAAAAAPVPSTPVR